VKRVRKQRDAWDEKKEIAAMAILRRFPQYFAYLHGWFESQDCIFLAMDYFEMGDLSHHLESKIPENQARDITQQLLRGLVELHGMGITHRDLKPTNIFVVSKSASSWDVRIGDFGISKRVSADETALRTITGTRHYMAPELDPWLVDNEEDYSYTQAVDVWALGILLFRMLTLQMAFRDPQSLRKYFKARSAFPEEPLLQESITPPCIEFLKAMLQPKPKDRPASKDTVSYEWMKAFQESCAVGGPIDTRNHQPAEPKTHSSQAQWLPRKLPGSEEIVRQQPWEASCLQSPSQELEPSTRTVASEGNWSNLLARWSPSRAYHKMKSQLMVGDAADVSPLPPQRRVGRRTSGDHPYFVNHNTRQDAFPKPKSPLSNIRDSPRSKEYQSGSLPSDPNIRLTGRLALRA
jgi:serine/threonine protein kinase